MGGMNSIVERYQLAVHVDRHHGVFQWRRRMGVHLAFHQDPINIAIHAIFSIVNAWAILLIAYPFSLFDIAVFNLSINMAIVTLIGMFVIYSCMDVGGAVVTTALFSATYPLCQPAFELLQESTSLMVISGIVLTIAALAVQVFIGHGISEKGIDDATENFAETLETKNPIYIALLPFYTYLDLMFMVGYRPQQARIVADITSELRPKLEAEIDTNIKENKANK
ncbi:MAG: hypothetical protein CL693_17775 [Cellvibrionaceae bacterium]|nr:hypothetical protein [Cellvibrionaceae bacterium]|tara:strand:+ start:4873 stop:5544 length:672 start_codon:yes stop_codon:yes gene_type:complete